MTTNVPTNLKSADITKFALRAAQVEMIRPPVAYWCYYYIVQTVLTKGLHNQDDECKQYVTLLMDKLEELKAEHSSNDAIIDDMAGQAYVEQFGLETFQRADNTMAANKVTRQTVDTLQAAATFLEVTHVWGQPSEEIASKIKYAKFHALRIAKAIKAGTDPNEGNPAPPIIPEAQEAVVLDPNDPEVQALTQSPPKATVEDVPDETDSLRAAAAARSNIDQSLHPSRDQSTIRQPIDPSLGQNESSLSPQSFNNPPIPPLQGAPISQQPGPDDINNLRPVSPFATAGDGLNDGPVVLPHDENHRATELANGSHGQTSPGNGYFHDAQFANAHFPDVQLPEVPPDPAAVAPTTMGPISPTGFITPSAQPPTSPQNIYTSPVQPTIAPSLPFAPPPSQVTHLSYQPSPPPQPPQNLPVQRPPPVQQPRQQPQVYNNQPAAVPQPRATTPMPKPPQAMQTYEVDDLAMVEAQKHAKWAISALNFEDVPTAVKELREALRSLGAS